MLHYKQFQTAKKMKLDLHAQATINRVQRSSSLLCIYLALHIDLSKSADIISSNKSGIDLMDSLDAFSLFLVQIGAPAKHN